MFIGNLIYGIVTANVTDDQEMLKVGYLPTNRIIPADRRWLEKHYEIRARLAVVTPFWGVKGEWAWTEEELRWFGVKKIQTPVRSLELPNQPVLVLWSRPYKLTDDPDSIRIIR